MNVRRFVAPEMQQALGLVKGALGEDAVILRTRKVKRGGLFSFMQKELIEVTAATPDRKPLPDQPENDRAGRAREQIEAHPAYDNLRDLQDEISDLKGSVRDLAERVKYDRLPSLPDGLTKRFTDMVRAGLDDRVAAELVQQLNQRFSEEQLKDDALTERELVGALAERIPIRNAVEVAGDRARIIALVGPTGVGKTTTVAKLATSYRFWGKRETALVSADTYRVAALEQLRTFAAIAGIPLEAVYQPAAMENILARHRSRQAVFIDTAGRSQSDIAKLDELGGFLDAAQPDEVLLCLSVSTRIEDQLDIIQRYQRLKPTGIIFTKLDETRGPGMIPNVLARAGLPLVFMTCGQNVPDDIIKASATNIARLVVNPDSLSELQHSRFDSWIKEERSPGNGKAVKGNDDD